MGREKGRGGGGGRGKGTKGIGPSLQAYYASPTGNSTRRRGPTHTMGMLQQALAANMLTDKPLVALGITACTDAACMVASPDQPIRHHNAQGHQDASRLHAHFPERCDTFASMDHENFPLLTV